MSNSLQSVHQLHEDDPFTMNYADHAKRTESDTYVEARKLLKSIVSTLGGQWYYGPGPYQDHHGGGLWLHDGKGWFMVKNLAGMEWASQFCADPAKVELLRQNAERLYAAFPQSKAEFAKLGYKDFDKVLHTPIKDEAGVAEWTDSIFNASVPLDQRRHTGVLPKGDGVHHYPTPVTDIELFKFEDFRLWVTDEEGQPAAVVPERHRNDPKNTNRVRVIHATPGTRLHAAHSAAQQSGEDLVLDADHHLSKAAFASQVRANPHRRHAPKAQKASPHARKPGAQKQPASKAAPKK